MCFYVHCNRLFHFASFGSFGCPLFCPCPASASSCYVCKVLKSMEQQSTCSDPNAPHIHFSTHLSSIAPPELGEAREASSQASSTSSASFASIISIENKFGKVDPYEHHQHHQPHPMHSTLMMMSSPMSPSPSASMSISLASLPQQYQSSSLSSVSSRPLPTPSSTPLTPVTPSSMNSRNTSHYYSQQPKQQQQLPQQQQQTIYFSSTTSEPGTYHHIRRAPEAIRHLGGCGERLCLPKPKIYRVIYPYKPQQMDEIELAYGDLLTVTVICDDGWFLGRSTLSGKFGTFPGNYVEPV